MPRISVVAPVFNEVRDTLNEFARRVSAAIESITSDYEIILVDDGSSNEAWEVICSLAATNSDIHGIRLARNFGQHVAITAGLDQADGDWVVVMDFGSSGSTGGDPRTLRKSAGGIQYSFRQPRTAPRIPFLSFPCHVFLSNSQSAFRWGVQ